MRVGQLAELVSVTPETVRYYTRIGFLAPLKSELNGYKKYSQQDEDRLRFIISARQLGFSVNDIEQILHHAAHGESACPLVRELIQQRLEKTEKQFQQAKALRKKMQVAIAQWELLPDKEPSKEMICHLIGSFFENTSNAADEN
jgi:DNA-binding transcriptional MerR regulator